MADHRWWLLASVVVGVAVGALAPLDYHDRDFAAFWLGSRMILEGKDPYDPAVWLPALRATAPYLGTVAPSDTGYGYPLWTAIATLPFALGTFDLGSRLWLGSQIGLGLVGLGALLSVLDVRRRPADVALLIVLMLASPSAQMLEEVANIQGFLLAVVSGGLALLFSGHAFAAGTLFGLLLIKPHLGLFFGAVLVLASRERVRLVSGASLSALALVLVSLAIRPGWIGEWLLTVARVNSHIGARATGWALGPLIGVPGIVPVVAAIGAFVLWWWIARPNLRTLSAAALAVSLFVTPYAGRYDALILFAPLAIAVASLASVSAKAHTMTMPLVVGVALALPWILHLFVLAHANEAIGSLVPIAVFGTVILCDRLARGPLVAKATTKELGARELEPLA